MYDCIIVGMGPAGMGAGIYAKRSGLEVLMIDEEAPGGLLNKISIVENYLGFKSISGPDLAYQMFEHINNEKVPYKIEKVLNIVENDGIKTVYTTKGEYKTKTIIIAIGRKLKKSGLPGEDKFTGKGISYCALCDAALYKDKDLVVLGGGNSAFEEAIFLKGIAKSIKIIVRKEISAEEDLVNDAKAKGIEIILGKQAKEFVGEDVLTGVVLEDDTLINCDGVFIYYGYAADTAFISNLNITDERGYIICDEGMRSKHEGIYACGDIVKKDLYQIINGVSEGAVAATTVKKDLDAKEEK